MSREQALQPTSRALHLVDVENLFGTPRPDPEVVRPLARLYEVVAGLGPRDHVVLASSHRCAASVWLEWPGGVRRLAASGPDGADHALLSVLSRERVAERFGRVVIGSGDGIFAHAAARLQAAETEVTVVCGEGALARRLRMATRDIRFLPRELAETCAVNLLRAVA